MSRLDQEKKIITKEDVLNSTSNGLDLYKKVVALKPRNGEYVGLCPFHSEKTGSFTVFGNKNSFKCHGCQKGGVDAIKFLQEYYNISFKEALDMASKDFNVQPNRSVVKLSAPIVKEPMTIDFEDMSFQDSHRKYWAPYELDEEFLRQNNVYAVNKWSICRRIQKISENTIVFAYAHESGGDKILQIGENVTRKWINTVENSALWFYNDYKEQKIQDLFICKSVKDALIFKKLGYAALATQNESGIILMENNYEKIMEICECPIVVFGSDFQAWHESLLITTLTNWRYENTPNYMLEYDINDPAEYVKQFGMQAYDTFLQRKNYIKYDHKTK